MPDLFAQSAVLSAIDNAGHGPRGIRDAYAPLDRLFGTWVGGQGWNLVAIPHNAPGPIRRPDDFKLIIQPYTESMQFDPITAPVPNHGGDATEMIWGAEYKLQINQRTPGAHASLAAPGELLHVENGMWLLLRNLLLAAAPGQEPNNGIVRQATVPHGDSALAVGTATTIAGPPSIPALDPKPLDAKNVLAGYFDPYGPPYEFSEFVTANPNSVLTDALGNLPAGHRVIETVVFDLSTEPQGGIVNIPFIRKHSDASKFVCTYWVETIEDSATGDRYDQLQYSQVTWLDFFDLGGPGLARWPHVNVNTLLKVGR